MFKHKNKIIVLLIILLFAVVYWLGFLALPTDSDYIKNEIKTTTPTETNTVVPTADTENYTPEPEKTTQAPKKENKNENTEPLKKCEPVLPAPYEEKINGDNLTCNFSIRCDAILNNLELLEKEKINIIPQNGIIMSEQEVIFYEGESVFNVLLRETKRNKIHFEFVNTPMYNSAYIKGIANIYERDCGNLSGWIYKVNGSTTSVGCSQYYIKPGDKIEWIFTCDLGNDV